MNQTKMGTNPCERVFAQLNSHVSGELAGEEAGAVSRHIEICPRCAEEYRSLVAVRQALKGAVSEAQAPADLERKIQEKLRSTRAPGGRLRLWVLVPVMASTLLAAWVGWLVIQNRGGSATPEIATQQEYIQSLFEQVTHVMRIGLGDHVHCAHFRKFPKNVTQEEATAKLGEPYRPLLPVVKSQIPDSYPLVLAHQCGYQGRRYLHFVFRGDEGLISLVITARQPGESFGGAAPPSEGSVVPIYQATADRFEIAGFESGQFLAYVVSDLNAERNMQLAANLASGVRQFLDGLQDPEALNL